ncbi:phosphatase PAP2 family protein [Acidimangrovimonas pyrenivorans]
MGGAQQTRLTLSLTAALALSQALFAAAPWIDLWVSALFYRPGIGFPLGRLPLMEALRQVYWTGSYVVFLGLCLALAASLLLGRARQVPARIWGFGVLGFLIGPALLVNALFKAHWGRARPWQVTEFGGAAQFTPAWQISDACHRNCSFVSGEAAGAAMVALVACVLLWPLVARRRRPAFAAGLGLFFALGAGLRVAVGGHFLSDVVFAGFLDAYVALALYRLLRLRTALPHLTAAALRADLRALARRLSPFR